MAPAISVLMSVFNTPVKYLQESIESILGQTFRDFEFLIVDDGNDVLTKKVLSSYATRDSRIQILENKRNIGLTPSLNTGIKHARGEWIARQDADDVSVPHRLEVQLGYLKDHAHIGLLGSAYGIIENNSVTKTVYFQPEEDRVLRWQLLFHNAFCHTSVFIKTQHMQRLLYDERFVSCQDYDAWVRVMQHTQGANVRDVLVYYRRHDASISKEKFSQQQDFANSIAINEIKRVTSLALSRETTSLLRSKYALLYTKRLDPYDVSVNQFLKLWHIFKTHYAIDDAFQMNHFDFINHFLQAK